MTYQDKFGVYRVGNFKFYSKVEAIEMHNKTGIHPHWDFNEAVYSSYDWTREPQESLPELYRQRAQQIRDKYDYLVLWYSGGADSSNILDTFINNNIKIDELLCFSNYEVTGNKDNWLNSEIFKVAMPRAEELKAKYPWMKIRMFDLGQSTIENFNQIDIVHSIKYDLNIGKSPHNIGRFDLRKKIKDWAELITAGKSVAMIHGMDKPRIALKNNKFVFYFLDMVDPAVPPRQQTLNTPGEFDELFYWSPDAPKIPIKQAHIIMNYLKLATTQTKFMSFERSDLAYKELHNGKRLWLSVHGIHSLIYPLWNTATFTVGKTPSVIFSKRDDWFLKEQDERVKTFYQALNRFFANLPDNWKNDPNDISRGIKLSVSKEYNLE